MKKVLFLIVILSSFQQQNFAQNQETVTVTVTSKLIGSSEDKKTKDYIDSLNLEQSKFKEEYLDFGKNQKKINLYIDNLNIKVNCDTLIYNSILQSVCDSLPFYIATDVINGNTNLYYTHLYTLIAKTSKSLAIAVKCGGKYDIEIAKYVLGILYNIKATRTYFDIKINNARFSYANHNFNKGRFEGSTTNDLLKLSVEELELSTKTLDTARTFIGLFGDNNFKFLRQELFKKCRFPSVLSSLLSVSMEHRDISIRVRAALEEKKKDTLSIEKAQQLKKTIFASIIAILFIVLSVFAIFYFLRTKKLLKLITTQKQIVEQKQKEILDSIEYALRIQTAILPPQKIVKQYLEDSFILYKPKDIVAGDFYWMETVNELVLFAACDCTGHGVPGAMVSVVCHNALNRAVREFGLSQPAAILDKTAEIVIESFSKSQEDIKDGMDISLCAYNAKTKTIQWAGANNPLWLLQNGELIETKADKQPIGMHENSQSFTNHLFDLNTGDSIYLFTDGFADQFGGETGQKKLTKRRFKDLILSIQEKSMQEQGIALDKFITEYRREVEQIDDILVMGVKI